MKLAASADRRIWIGVCIDDFGLRRGINDAALELIGSGRVSAPVSYTHLTLPTTPYV